MAKKQIRHLREGQTEFQKVFSRLCETRSAWQVWSDFVEMVAISISNAVEIREKVKQEREARYMTIIRTYTKKEQAVFPELFGILVQALQRNPEQDFLGEMFMAMELGNHWKGQFFTPYDLCKAMAAVNVAMAGEKLEVKDWIGVHEGYLCAMNGERISWPFIPGQWRQDMMIPPPEVCTQLNARTMMARIAPKTAHL